MHNVNTTDNTTSHDKELLYDFPALGSYEISVVGEHNGVSVSVDKTVMAECKKLNGLHYNPSNIVPNRGVFLIQWYVDYRWFMGVL